MLKAQFISLAVLIAFGHGSSFATGAANDHVFGLGDAPAAFGASAYSSSVAASPPTASAAIPFPQESPRPFSTVGAGASVSSLGLGIEVATPLILRTNLRAGFNVMGLSESFQSDGIHYDATLTLRSFATLLDWYPFKSGFHISPGALVYNGNRIRANVSVPGGDSFTLNGVSYLSAPATPVTGSGTLKFDPAAPMVLLGWGNLVPRTRHLSFPVELGAVFQGSAQTVLTLGGDVCDSSEEHCGAISADPMFQSNMLAQQKKLDSDVNSLRYYPVLRFGFAYKF